MASKPDSSSKPQAIQKTVPPAPRGSPCYEEISKLIAGEDGPPWLPKFLSRWAPSLTIDRNVQVRQPGRADMRKILRTIGEAAALITRGLGESSVREFLEDGPLGPMPYVGVLDHALRDLEARASQAQGSPHLVNSKGITKAGRGRAAPSGAFPPQIYCALFIAEVWRHFHSEYPTIRDKSAAQAADSFWRATGKRRKEWGNSPLPAWRHHFQRARALKSTENVRAEIRRHLLETEKRW